MKELLRIDSMASKEAIVKRFEELAKILFNEYEIIKRGIHYDFLEIEFYFFNSNHKDDATYERTIKEGRWFFHPSGVDISFDSDEMMLIRDSIGNNLIQEVFLAYLFHDDLKVLCAAISFVSDRKTVFAFGLDHQSLCPFFVKVAG